MNGDHQEKAKVYFRQSRRQYAWTAAFALAVQLYAASTAVMMVRAASAAWWVTLFSGLPGTILWLPVWRMTQEGETGEWTETLLFRTGRVFGKAALCFWAALFLLDAAIAMKLLSMLVRQYVIPGGAEVAISIASAAALGFSLALYGGESLARFTWLVRFVLLLILSVGIAAIWPRGHGENLYPVLGKSIGETLSAFPAGAGAFSGIAALPLFSKGGSAPSGERQGFTFREGALPILLASLLSGCMMLLNQLTLSPLMMSDSIFWARRLLLGAEAVENGYILQVLFLLGLMGALMISMAYGMISSSKCLMAVLESKSQGGVMALCVSFLGIFAFGTGEKMNRVLWQVMEGKFFAAAAALGMVYIVFRLRGSGRVPAGKEKA